MTDRRFVVTVFEIALSRRASANCHPGNEVRKIRDGFHESFKAHRPDSLGFVLLLIRLVLPAAIAAGADPAVRPNIVIVYADDMGYGDLGIQNPDSKIPTPNLDRLAREGMRFTDAHSSCGDLFSQPLRAADRLLPLAEVSRHRAAVGPFGIRTRRISPCRKCSRPKATAPPVSANGTWAGIGKRSKIPVPRPTQNRIFRRRIRLVEADSRRSARSWLRLLLRQRRAKLPPLHAGSRTIGISAAADRAR